MVKAACWDVEARAHAALGAAHIQPQVHQAGGNGVQRLHPHTLQAISHRILNGEKR